ncbi:glutamate carboxypeptidase [Rhodococcus sp. 27YEA15]|uniref:M20/M25/M40 family metallo-hydrolase n=1 Tax=Rhodococcus sp. 27YEA15 TaxID=3156259 RepID=UPI003C7B6175
MTTLLGLAEQHLPQILDDAIALIEIESPSHDLESVARSAKWTSDLIQERLGVSPDWVVVEGRTHLITRFGSSPTRLMLLGHHDTVWPIGTLQRLPAAVTDGALRGPGGLDMKLGVVQAIHALAITRDLHGPDALDGVTLMVTGDEEIGSPTSRALIEEHAAGAVLVLEAGGDGGELKTVRKGVSLYRIHVAGRAAHAGLEPEKGINAAVELSHLVVAISAMSSPEHATTVTPTVTASGTTTNTVPAQAFVDVDVRATSAAEQARVDANMRALRAIHPEAVVTVTGGVNRPPLEAAMSAPLLALAAQISLDNDLPEPVGLAVGGASDGNFTAGIGVPTLDGLGGVGGGAHAETEHALVSFIAPRTALVAGLIRTITTEGGDGAG